MIPEIVTPQNLLDSRPELAVVKLCVSMAKCLPLERYFVVVENIRLACEYNGIDYLPYEFYHGDTDRHHLADFFQKLVLEPVKFAAFFSYTLSDIVPKNNLDDWGVHDRRYFEIFLRDLRVLGFDAVATETGWQVKPTISGFREEQRVLDSLDEMLGEIDPEFIKIREGAWTALLSGTPDSERQAISSSRELLRQTIDSLAKSKDKTRKDRVLEILENAEKDTKVVECVAELVDSTYAVQSKGTHAEPSFERALYIIRLTEYTLYYMLMMKRPH